jgi:transcriptional repressor NrdR
MPRIVKRDGTRVPFDESKLRASIGLALQKRPISAEQIEAAITHISAKLRATGERELPSSSIGEAVMGELRKLDNVAFVRFASVYRNFTDISEFREEVDRLEKGS